MCERERKEKENRERKKKEKKNGNVKRKSNTRELICDFLFTIFLFHFSFSIFLLSPGSLSFARSLWVFVWLANQTIIGVWVWLEVPEEVSIRNWKIRQKENGRGNRGWASLVISFWILLSSFLISFSFNYCAIGKGK